MVMEEKRRVMEEGEIMVWRRAREGYWRKVKWWGREFRKRREEKDERQKEVPEEGGHAEGGVRDVKGESRAGKQCQGREWSRSSREQYRRIEQE